MLALVGLLFNFCLFVCCITAHRHYLGYLYEGAQYNTFDGKIGKEREELIDLLFSLDLSSSFSPLPTLSSLIVKQPTFRVMGTKPAMFQRTLRATAS